MEETERTAGVGKKQQMGEVEEETRTYMKK